MSLAAALRSGAGLMAYVSAIASRMNSPAANLERATEIGLSALATDPVVTRAAAGGLLVSIRRLRDGTTKITPHARWSRETTEALDAIASQAPKGEPKGIVIDGSILVRVDDAGEIVRNGRKVAHYLRTIGHWDLAKRIDLQASKTAQAANKA